MRSGGPPDYILVAVVVGNAGPGPGAAFPAWLPSGRGGTTTYDTVDVAVVVHYTSAATFNFQFCLVRVVVFQIGRAVQLVLIRVVVNHGLFSDVLDQLAVWKGSSGMGC